MMDKIFRTCFGCFVVWVINRSKATAISSEVTSDRFTACADSSFQPPYVSGEVIAVRNIQYGTKLTGNCSGYDCCVYDVGDCLLRYDGTALHQACSGKQTCQLHYPPGVDATSCGSDYPILSNYLTMEYYCVPESRIVPMCGPGSSTIMGKPLYIENLNYPVYAIDSSSLSCSCSVEALDCSSQIKVSFVHFQLNDGGGCPGTQKIQINDNGTDHEYTCSNNTGYEITSILTSSSNYLSVTLDNPKGIAGGYFWIAFEEISGSVQLKLNCGQAARTMCMDCRAPASQGYNFTYTDTTYKATASVLCATGYEGTPNPGNVACLDTGDWGTVTGCDKKDCSAPASPGYNFTYTDTTYEATASVVCATGYDGSPNPGIVACLDTGDWQIVTGCDKKDCRKPDSQGYNFTYTDTTYEATASVVCATGYEGAPNPRNVTCLDTGNWETVTGCNRKDCNVPSRTGYNFTYIHTTYEATATVECATGYDGTPNPGNVACLDAGYWETVTGCDRKDCNVPSSSGYSFSYTDTTYEATASVLCATGYEGTPNPAAVECLATGLWEAVIGCVITDCNSLPNPTNGQITHSTTTYLSIANYTCNSGYNLLGDESRVCEADGNWSRTAPICSAADCGSLSRPDHGTVAYSSNDTTFKVEATYSCNLGYNLVGNARRRCQADGNWSSSEPECRIKDCGDLTNQSNGYVKLTTTTYQSQATYSCNEGYSLNGNVERVCQANVTWSGSVPSCQIKDCGNLTNQGNGYVTYTSTTYESVANYSCNEGYSLNGTAERVCQADTTWSGDEPTCQIKDCGKLAAPANGNVTYSNNGASTYLEIAAFSCNTGYALSGASHLICEASGNWDGTSPACTTEDNGRNSSDTGVIVGSVVGALVLMTVIIVLVVYIIRLKSKSDKWHSEQAHRSTDLQLQIRVENKQEAVFIQGNAGQAIDYPSTIDQCDSRVQNSISMGTNSEPLSSQYETLHSRSSDYLVPYSSLQPKQPTESKDEYASLNDISS